MTSVFTKVKVPTVGFLKIFIGGTLNLNDNLSSNLNQLKKVEWESRMKIKQKHSINHLFHFNFQFKHFHPIRRFSKVISNMHTTLYGPYNMDYIGYMI